jgi:hypothetical protein
MATTLRRMTAKVPLGDISPRFTAAAATGGLDAAESTRRRAWFSVQPMLSRRLQPLFDDGWEVVPSSLGPHSLHVSIQRERRRGLPSFFARSCTRYVSEAVVLLQRPVHG